MRRVVWGALVALVAAIVTVSAVAAISAVDVRGGWDGNAVADIGTFRNTFDIATEDFATGAISGTANAGTYTLVGTVTGSSIHVTSATSGYTAQMVGSISPDGTVMSGTFTDTNGRAGTFEFSRTSAVAPGTPGPVIAPGAAAPTPAPPPAGCTFGGFGSGPPPTATTSDPGIVARVGGTAASMPAPSAILVDATDARGRVFVTNVTTGALSVIDGRPRDASAIAVSARIAVGRFPDSLAIDPATGHVFVSLAAECRIAEVDGRAATPTLLGTVDVPDNPAGLAFDPGTGRLFVALPGANEVIVLRADRSIETTIAIPGGPSTLALDSGRGYLYVGTVGSPATGGAAGGSPPGGVAVVDAAAAPPRLLTSSFAASQPTAIVPDPASGTLLVLEAGAQSISTVSVGAGGVLARVGAAPLDLGVPSGTGARVGPGQGFAAAAVLLPGRHALLVPLTNSATALVFAIAPDGSLTLTQAIAGVLGGSHAALDPSTGRVFVSELSANEVAVLALDQPAAPAPSIVEALPGPFDVSLAPKDVARSVGITLLLMLLVGAPTPIFNSTLTANRTLIERWARRRRPRWLRGSGVAGFSARAKALSATWAGLVFYLGMAALLYSFLDSGFPLSNGLRTFGAAAFGLAVGTAVSQVPGEVYVRRRYGERGRVKVALWTLGLAVACVLITRITAVQPGYVYGIIGGFTFGVTLNADDKGRMAFRGISILMAVGFVAWFVRVPFQPGGLIGGDVSAVADRLLANLFISAVEGTAIGLIPLRYLAGENLFAWSRGRWALLWALSLVLFAHVILYPVSSFEPNPSSTGLWTIALTVIAYSAIAIGFWSFFRRRERRQKLRAARAAANAARAAANSGGDATNSGGDATNAAGAATNAAGDATNAAGGAKNAAGDAGEASSSS